MCTYICLCSQVMGGDLGRTGGTVAQNLRWGDGPRIRPPNILRSTVIGCEAKYELIKKGLKEEFLVLKSRFLVKKRVICITCMYIRFQAVEIDKSRVDG